MLIRVTPASPRFLLKGAHMENVEGQDVLVCTVHVMAKAEQGRANRELVESFAKLLDLQEYALTLLSGAKSRTKFFSVTLP